MTAPAPGWVKERLRTLGWLRNGRPSLDQLRAALRQYQEFHGLAIPSGDFDGDTKRSLLAPRFCGCPDVMEQRAGVSKWPMKDITMAIAGKLPGFADSDFHSAAEECCRLWNGTSGIRLAMSTNPRTANIVMGTGPIDSAGDTLAWSELPNGTKRQLRQKYDTYERWALFAGWRNGWMDALRVITHEVGHACGLGHGPAGCQMAPTVSEIRAPRAWDIREMVARYGAASPSAPPADPAPTPAGPPPANPAPPAGGGSVLTIQLQGAIEAIHIPGYRITKLQPSSN